MQLAEVAARAGRSEKQCKDLAEEKAAAAKEAEDLRARLESEMAANRSREEKLAQMEASHKQALFNASSRFEDRIRALEGERDELQTALASAEQHASSAREESARAVDDIKARLAEVAARAGRSEKQCKAIAEEKAAATKEAEELRARLESEMAEKQARAGLHEAECSALRTKVDTASKSERQANDQAESLATEMKMLRRRSQDLEREVGSATSAAEEQEKLSARCKQKRMLQCKMPSRSILPSKQKRQNVASRKSRYPICWRPRTASRPTKRV